MPDEPSADSVPERGGPWFDSLFASHSRAIFRYFARRVPADQAEDLAAEVLATAWRRREVIPEGFELPWLYCTAGFLLSNHRRRASPVLVADIADSTADDPAAWDADPMRRVIADSEVRAVLGQLTERERRILLLNCWEGLDGEALAKALGMTRGSAASALSRARSHLRELWLARAAG